MRFMEIDISDDMKFELILRTWDGYQELIMGFEGVMLNTGHDNLNRSVIEFMGITDAYNVLRCIRDILGVIGYTEHCLLLKEYEIIKSYFDVEIEIEQKHGSMNRLKWLHHSLETLECHYAKAIKQAK